MSPSSACLFESESGWLGWREWVPSCRQGRGCCSGESRSVACGGVLVLGMFCLDREFGVAS